AAFNASSSGTVTASNTTSTLTTTTGTALNVRNTTIGSSGLKFKSISANGGANGIVLVTTGADAATNVPTATENAGSGVFLYNTKNVSLSWMQIHDHQNYAIYGNSVN